MSNDDLAEDACIEIEEQRVNLILAFGTLTGKVMHVDAEGAVCLLIEVSRLRAENALLRAENERLREGIQSLAERLEVDPSGTDKIDDLEAEIETMRAENARLRAQVAEYFAEPETHPVEGT